jgi:predicted regulator of Ras-like GTPase activity (Roadblock/LC7/MglB family)
MSTSAKNFNWLLSSFVESTIGVEEAIAVSSDGLLMAVSSNMDRGGADKLAAIVSGLRSLADGASRIMGKGALNHVIIEMNKGFLLVATISGGSSLGVTTSKNCDLGQIGYDMTLLIERVGSSLTPELVTELKNNLQL